MTDPTNSPDLHLLELLSSAGVADPARRMADAPGIAMIVGVSRALREVELAEIAPSSVFHVALTR